MKSSEFKRWLEAQGAIYKLGKGSHLKVSLNARNSVLPMHNKELGTGLVNAIKEAARPEIGGAMLYPVNLKKDGKFFLATFPDIPEAITQGRIKEEALQSAQEALETALDFYFDEQRTVPAPSDRKRRQRGIELPPSIAAKVVLMNEMIRQRVRPAELARRLNASPQAVNRLVNLRYSSKIDGIDQALKALGKTLEVRAV